MERNDGELTVPHIELGCLIGLQLALFLAYFYFCQLPEKGYFAPVIAFESAKHPFAILFIFFYLVFGCFFFRKLTWAAVDSIYGARFFVTAISATIMWQFATYDYNFYYDQAHYFDRLLLIVMAVLVYCHPLFVPPFTALAIAIASQLHYPLPEAAWLWPDKQILFDALILFTAYLIIAVFRQVSSHLFLYAVLCLTGGVYFYAAIAKLSIGPTYYSWLMDNKLSNLWVSSYITGWFGFLDAGIIVNIATYLQWLNLPIAVITLLIELSGVVILGNKNIARFVLFGFILLHIAIGLTSGIFFWMWCAYDLALIMFISKTSPCAISRIFNPKSFVLSIAIIVFSNIYFRPIHFAWFDTRLSNFFTIYGTGASGNTYELEPHFFSPYDIMFCQSRFYYLLNGKVLVGTYGTTQNYWLARQLETTNLSSFADLRNEHGETFYDKRLAGQFRKFIKHYVANAQKRSSKFIFLNYLAPPYHFGSATADRGYKFQEPLTDVQVYFEEHVYTDDNILRIRKETIINIPIDSTD
jgi:hypothetical protein